MNYNAFCLRAKLVTTMVSNDYKNVNPCHNIYTQCIIIHFHIMFLNCFPLALMDSPRPVIDLSAEALNPDPSRLTVLMDAPALFKSTIVLFGLQLIAETCVIQRGIGLGMG